MDKYLSHITWIIFLCALFAGCSTSEKTINDCDDKLTDTRYKSATGSDFLRNEIEIGKNSVIRLQNTGNYRTYYFDPEELPLRAELSDVEFGEMAVYADLDQQSRAGSGLILSNEDGNSVILTASHVAVYPDTVWHHRGNATTLPEAEVEAVSVLQSTIKFFIGPNGVYWFENVISDEIHDIALVVYNWENEERPRLQPLDLAAGQSADLNWTDQVYAIGYPLGNLMVTRSMVSKSGQTQSRNFILDASFNRGFSGGALFAEKGDGTGLEWIGMVTSASAEPEEYLAPESFGEEEFRPGQKYAGTIYARRIQRINYGITYTVGVDRIRNFVDENSEELERRGITIPLFE